MSSYRIVEEFPGGFVIQRKTWMGWRNCDFAYWGTMRARTSYGSEAGARRRLEDILAQETFRERVVYETDGPAK